MRLMGLPTWDRADGAAQEPGRPSVAVLAAALGRTGPILPLSIDNNLSERSVRPVAVGRNYVNSMIMLSES